MSAALAEPAHSAPRHQPRPHRRQQSQRPPLAGPASIERDVPQPGQ